MKQKISLDVLQDQINASNDLLGKIVPLIHKSAEMALSAKSNAELASIKVMQDKILDLQKKLTDHHAAMHAEMVRWFNAHDLNPE